MKEIIRLLAEHSFDILKSTGGNLLAHKIFNINSAGEHINDFQNTNSNRFEANNLFTQLLTKIHQFVNKNYEIIDVFEYQELKLWFEITAKKFHCEIVSQIFNKLPQMYFDKQDLSVNEEILKFTKNNAIQYLFLTLIYRMVQPKLGEEKFYYIKQNFYDNITEKSDASLAAEEYVNKNPIESLFLFSNKKLNPFEVWNSFNSDVKNIILHDENMKKFLYGYRQINDNANIDDVIHTFICDFMQNIADEIKMETEGDMTGAKLKRETPVIIWMQCWLALSNNTDRLRMAISRTHKKQSVGDSIMNKVYNIKTSLEEYDKELARKTVQPGGLVYFLNKKAEEIRGDRKKSND